MDGSTIINGIWTFLNSGIGFAVIWAAMIGFFMFLASRFNPFQEKWKKYEGSIITGIRLALTVVDAKRSNSRYSADTSVDVQT